MARWLSSLSPDIPLHLSRFFPRHKMLDKEITPRATLEKAARIASRYLDHVYLGNI
jgi:pyruvate formate lyase activating enzyme